MKPESHSSDSWRLPTYWNHDEEGHVACRRILEIDALWRMSDPYQSDFHSHDGSWMQMSRRYVAVPPTKPLSH